VRGQVDLDVAERHAGGAVGVAQALLPAPVGAHPRQQLGHAERLLDVVVGAGVERAHLVALFGTGREHQHRHVRSCAQAHDELDAVAVGQAEIDDHQIGLSRCASASPSSPSPPRTRASLRSRARRAGSGGCSGRLDSGGTLGGGSFMTPRRPRLVAVEHRRRPERQREDQRRAAALDRLRLNRAAMRLDDRLADGQTETDAGRPPTRGCRAANFSKTAAS
jgi:hypothetical protein